MDLIPRNGYLSFLRSFRDKQLVKVVSGVRRCGKSTLLLQFQQELLAQGIAPERIISLNFEDFANAGLTTCAALHEHVCSRLVDGQTTYVFLDEIQHVQEFERAVNSLLLRDNVDLYVTGSNAYFLSGELATLLSGRYVQVRMLPLSFAEFVQACGTAPGLPALYARYLQASFPYALAIATADNAQALQEYLNGIYHTVLLKDIVQRLGISDVERLEAVVRFVFDSIGSPISAKKIADRLTSAGRKTDSKTVEKYLRALCDGFILYEAPRYNIRGGQYLSTQPKYYAVDLGLRRLLLGQRGGDVGHELENVVYLELLRRGHEVCVGKSDEGEVDFVARKAGETSYYQVAVTVLDETVRQRELAPLARIRDHCPKMLLTLDDIEPEADFDGIRKRHALQWLLEGQTSRPRA